MSTIPRIALLGCGYWGKNLARNLHELDVLALVCDPSEASRATAGEIAPGVATSAYFNDAIQADDIDAIAIATPAETHFDLAVVALRAGKDVFVEKPLALKSDDGSELQCVADEHGRILMVGHLLEYHPAVLRLRELIDAGELGHVNYVYSNRLNFGKVRTEENALWSFAPHDIAIILRLLGEMPNKVTCVGGSFLTPGLADVTVSSLMFESGRRAHIFVSWLNPFKEQKLVIVGEQKMAVFNDVEPEHKLVLFDQRVDLAVGLPVLQRNGQETVKFSSDEPLRRQCEHFIECIQTRRTPLTDARSGVRVLRVLEACQESLQQSGCPISINGH
jgi:UDP-2-acetamido-3-amino-2,3-dideoxy-glucuronate N-acetyltransferase